MKQDIHIYVPGLLPAKRLDRMDWIFVWALMGGRGMFMAKKIRFKKKFYIFFLIKRRAL